MKNWKILLFLLTSVLVGCETLYTPELDKVENFITVDARVSAGTTDNLIKITKSAGYNDKFYFEPINNAVVNIVDDLSNSYECAPLGEGKYQVNFDINPDREYKLIIKAEGDTYESLLEAVPEEPKIDTFYLEELEQLTQAGGVTSVEDFKSTTGQQTYVDIDVNDAPQYFRFYARKVLEFVYPFDTVIGGEPILATKYCWKTLYPSGTFNIVGPSVYAASNNIIKHPLEYFEYNKYVKITLPGFDNDNMPIFVVSGWIYIIHQYGITESSYKFYKDLNNQLETSGKIFDPLYIQARSNMTCTSDKNKVILGNFELSYYKQSRYYLRIDPKYDVQVTHKIEEFHDIPFSGVVSIYKPDFWEF